MMVTTFNPHNRKDHIIFADMILHRFIDHFSFIIEEALPEGMKHTANQIPLSLINSPPDSDLGLMESFDKPLGCSDHISSFKRPAVLRQFFGAHPHDNKEVIYCYGTGSGSTTVGTHPSYNITRPMTQPMHLVAEHLHKTLLKLKKSDHHVLGSLPTPDAFNHCTVLFYFHKSAGSPNKMLGFHTDNCYSQQGNFLHDKNTQKVNTVTCVLTLGTDRDLILQRQFTFKHPITKRRRYEEVSRKHIQLKSESLFVLHPDDERPFHLGKNLTSRCRHGVPSFSNKEALSVAIVFRTVTPITKVKSSHIKDPTYTPKYIASVRKRLQDLSRQCLNH
jgi:hypothetical protein